MFENVPCLSQLAARAYHGWIIKPSAHLKQRHAVLHVESDRVSFSVLKLDENPLDSTAGSQVCCHGCVDHVSAIHPNSRRSSMFYFYLKGGEINYLR